MHMAYVAQGFVIGAGSASQRRTLDSARARGCVRESSPVGTRAHRYACWWLESQRRCAGATVCAGKASELEPAVSLLAPRATFPGGAILVRTARAMMPSGLSPQDCVSARTVARARSGPSAQLARGLCTCVASAGVGAVVANARVACPMPPAASSARLPGGRPVARAAGQPASQRRGWQRLRGFTKHPQADTTLPAGKHEAQRGSARRHTSRHPASNGAANTAAPLRRARHRRERRRAVARGQLVPIRTQRAARKEPRRKREGSRARGRTSATCLANCSKHYYSALSQGAARRPRHGLQRSLAAAARSAQRQQRSA